MFFDYIFVLRVIFAISYPFFLCIR